MSKLLILILDTYIHDSNLRKYSRNICGQFCVFVNVLEAKGEAEQIARLIRDS